MDRNEAQTYVYSKFYGEKPPQFFTCMDVEKLPEFKDIGHCSSCHSDWEEGYNSACYFEDGNDDLMTCCTFAMKIGDCIKKHIMNEKEVFKKLREIRENENCES